MMKLIRLKKDQKLVKSLVKEIADVESGVIIGLGALSEASLKIYDLDKKKYIVRKYKGNLEIGSFTAIIAKNPDGSSGIHPHIVISSKGFESCCGHLEEGKVAATFEAFVINSNQKVVRYCDEEIGLNLLKL